MDKTILKNFAVESRKDLMDKIERKISLYYVNENFDKSINGDLIVLSNDKHSITLTKKQSDNRDNLVKRIHELGIEQVIEESAYTWFNRLVAIRYMEINDYLPLTQDNQSLGFRVLSSQDNTLDPEILKFTNLSNTSLDIDFNPNKYSNLTNTDEKFKYVLLLVCKKLGKVIPQVFDGITDYIDLLIPDNLLSNGSVLDKLIKIPENNFKEVEVIGWLYQYYNQTEKDRAMSKKSAYSKEEIPYVTQLFTPDWIVKYMVENSLGRYWIEHGGDESLTKNWKYFIKDNIAKTDVKILPTEITCIDPCSGSGHILVYIFEILFQIYESAGYSKQDIPELILKNNLYGLDIDDRAGQLSVLSVILQARKYDKNIFNKEIIKDINIISIQDSSGLDQYSLSNVPSEIKSKVDYLVETFRDAKEIGSLLIVKNNDYLDVFKYLEQNNLETIILRDPLKLLIKEAGILSNKYDVVVTNPPYMSNSLMTNKLKQYILDNYSIFKNDLCTCFVGNRLVKKSGFLGMITQHTWLFSEKYTKMRENIIKNYSVCCLNDLGPGAFDDISGEVVQTASFVFSNSNKYTEGIYYKLNESQNKEQDFLNKKNKYLFNISNINKITGMVFAFWLSSKTINILYNEKTLGEFGAAKQGLSTTDNNRFLRLWHEIDFKKIDFLCFSCNSIIERNSKWFPYNKGGRYKKWSPINEYVVNYENNGYEIKKSVMSKYPYLKNPDFVVKNTDSYFKHGITWNDVSTSLFSCRLIPNGYIFADAGPMFFSNDDELYLGYFNSNTFQFFANIICQGLHYSTGQIPKIPYIMPSNPDYIKYLVRQNIDIAKEDWDSDETSWDFKEYPLIRINKDLWDATAVGASMQKYYGKQLEVSCPLELCWLLYNGQCDEKFNQLKKNEEELNRIFIDIYGLQDELTPEVEDKDITIRNIDKLRDIKSFISYAVGCMFGRYSLDEEGLIYAGGEWDKSKYKTFIPDNDNIIPIADNNDIFYSDDIVGKFIKFVEITFGKDTLRENLDYIAETLGKKGIETSEETIRRYFLNDFYKDHLQTYQKRPIYWMFDSGKSNGFKCLIYMHRYNEQTISKIKVDYFLKVQESYRNQLAAVQERLNGVNGLTTAEIKELRNKEKDLTDKLKECKDYYEKLDHIANEMIKIDLDDGVKVNYAKFEAILAKVK